jgi:hypothetical protein
VPPPAAVDASGIAEWPLSPDSRAQQGNPVRSLMWTILTGLFDACQPNDHHSGQLLIDG